MHCEQVRENSILKALSLGIDINRNLPLLDANLEVRPLKEIVCRTLAVFAAVASSYGFNRELAMEWLRSEKVLGSLSKSEIHYFTADEIEPSSFQQQVEALNALGWSLGIVDHLDFQQTCDDSLVTAFPDIKVAESSNNFQKNLSLRSKMQIVEKCDLAYCLHWAINQARIEDKTVPQLISPSAVIQRRRALEWILSSDDWDEINLDT